MNTVLLCLSMLLLTINNNIYHKDFETNRILNYTGNTVKDRFNPPKGYYRIESKKNSWSFFLQNLPLKYHGTKVKLYDGRLKSNLNSYVAVVDLNIGKKNLQQCADAVMRLRGDFLYKQGRFNEIQFLFVNGKNSKYIDWLRGSTPNPENYWNYMENVFNYASTLSLDKQLNKKNISNLEIGDVFIKPGSPGHAVIVVDKCVNFEGKVKFILAQSYMPAQEIQILSNLNNPNSPWYDLDFGNFLYTSEYTFTKNQLKTF